MEGVYCYCPQIKMKLILSVVNSGSIRVYIGLLVEMVLVRFAFSFKTVNDSYGFICSNQRRYFLAVNSEFHFNNIAAKCYMTVTDKFCSLTLATSST
jgi:collagenase-like PrtC family protease